MKPEHYVGKTLSELADQTGVSWQPIHVFVLEDEEDDTGKHLMAAYSLRQIITAHPAAAAATVVTANDYYGDIVLRVKS